MMIWSEKKILVFALCVLSLAVGIGIGVYAGDVIKKKEARQSGNTGRPYVELDSLPFMAAVAASDGKIDDKELEVILTLSEKSLAGPDQREAFRQFMYHSARSESDVKEVCRQLSEREDLKGNSSSRLRRTIAKYLYSIAAVDGKIPSAELVRLRQFMGCLGVSPP